ncbi:MAG: methylated-DNA--[protein]-cysteine S-methyltransferase [Bowdeniella nasicola]|nr:methylated-DNA--[protein]-cysteine S-methyltransferase [Bowdeniella nasicola]
MVRAACAIGDRHTRLTSPVGELIIVARDMRISGVFFADHRTLPPPQALGEPIACDDDVLITAACDQLAEYFAGTRRTFALPTYAAGTVFQRRVWKLVSTISYGSTMTYRQLAALLGNAHAAQSIGQAVGANPLSIVIPCHRVIGADRQLRGYAGGVWRKQFLLELEEPEEERRARLF